MINHELIITIGYLILFIGYGLSLIVNH